MRSLVYFFAGLGFLLAQTGVSVAQEDADAEAIKRYEFEQLVKDYILNNPEIIAEAIRILNDRADAASRESTKQAILKNHDLLENDPLSVVLGNPEGDVTLVEFYDYRCPYCRESHERVLKLIETDPGVRVVLKQFPVKDRPGERPISLISARIAMIAHDKGLFLPFHDAMYKAEPPLTEARVFEIAGEVGLDVDALKEEMTNPKITRHLRETLVLASEIGVTGTPTFVMGDIMIPGMVDFEILQQLVDYTRTQRAKAGD